MSFGKWMGGILGWSAFGPLGGIIGFLIGTMFDAAANGSEGDFMRLTEEQSQQGNRNSFFISMLVLAAYIVKADGKVMHSEMELVCGMLRQNFGEDAAQQGDVRILRHPKRRAAKDGPQFVVAGTVHDVRVSLEAVEREDAALLCVSDAHSLRGFPNIRAFALSWP